MVARKPRTLHPTREAWMLAGIDALRPMFEKHAVTVPPVRVSVGWPGGRSARKDALGQCWHPDSVDDKIAAVFVSPVQHDPVEVLETLAHEMIHAAGHYHHKAPFQRVALALGFENGGKVKTSRAESPTLYKNLDKIARTLGAFPHSRVSGSANGGAGTGLPKQGTRMLKVACPTDGYTVRATAKWLDQAVPACPLCDETMEVLR